MRNSRQFAYSQGKVKLRPMSRVNVHVFMPDGNAFNIDASTGFIPLIAEFGEVRVTHAGLLLGHVENGSPILQLVVIAGLGSLSVPRDRHLEDANYLAGALVCLLQRVVAMQNH